MYKSEITNIRTVEKFGAFGDPSKYGMWVYGKRPDGKTVACKSETLKDGTVRIWSYWKSSNCKENEVDECETTFSEAEWLAIINQPKDSQIRFTNSLLAKR